MPRPSLIRLAAYGGLAIALASAAALRGDPIAARQAGAFDATADAPVRDRALSALRAALPSATLHHVDPTRLARLRAEARRADIDIGE